MQNDTVSGCSIIYVRSFKRCMMLTSIELYITVSVSVILIEFHCHNGIGKVTQSESCLSMTGLCPSEFRLVTTCRGMCGYGHSAVRNCLI